LGLNATIAFRSTIADQVLYLDMLNLMSVKNFTEFSRILGKSPIPLNAVYADKSGNIGYKGADTLFSVLFGSCERFSFY
jgi:acyl-homoserine lactone acylase PvdQ